MNTPSAVPTADTRLGHIGGDLFAPAMWTRLAACLHLSRRELQIVQLVFEDHKEHVIGAKLGISPHTVNTYLQRLYRKLHVSSRVQLIVRVLSVYLSMSISGPG